MEKTVNKININEKDKKRLGILEIQNSRRKTFCCADSKRAIQQKGNTRSSAADKELIHNSTFIIH